MKTIRNCNVVAECFVPENRVWIGGLGRENFADISHVAQCAKIATQFREIFVRFFSVECESSDKSGSSKKLIV